MIFHRPFTHLFYLGLLAGALTLLQSCGPRLSSRANEYLSQTAEVSECLTTQTYSSSIPVVATAKFYKRSLQLVSSAESKLKNMVLGDPLADALPIPYAEVAVYSSHDKKLVQCGRTDVNGNLVSVDGTSTLDVPAKAQSYIIKVYARSRVTLPNKGIQANASIKEDIYTNSVHSIETTFSSDGLSLSPITLLAYARQTDDFEIRGGAFNIFNNFIQTYLFLDNSLTVPANQLECLSDRLNIYWKAGFNPVQYLMPSSDPASLSDNTSFFDKATNRLYITGGQVGDVSLSNTDHFDDFAVIHEMGHFIEYHCGKLTKGGTHPLIVRIDQRLAWHEAWANNLAVTVMNNRLQYLDPSLNLRLTALSETAGWSFLNNTYGFTDTYQNIGNESGFMMDFKKPGNAPGEWQIGGYYGLSFDQVNSNLYPGEGHAREGAISRALFKTSHTCASTCTSTPTSFTSLWQAFDAYTGIGQSTHNLVSSHLFFELFKSLIGSVTWTSNYKTIVEAEAMQLFSDHNLTSGGSKKYVSTVSSTDYLNWVPYGHKLIVNSSCTNKTLIQPRTDEPIFTGLNSDQRYSNHFYSLDMSTLTGLTSLTVKFDYFTGSATEHDLIIFEDGYHFNDDYACSNGASSCSSSNYVATRTTTTDVAAANRTPVSTLATAGASYTKSIANLNAKLSANKKYILNIRAYTANKSLSASTQYGYTITSNLGTLCPE